MVVVIVKVLKVVVMGVVVVVVVVVGLWCWLSGGGCSGDSLCKGGSIDSCRSARVKVVVVVEVVVDWCCKCWVLQVWWLGLWWLWLCFLKWWMCWWRAGGGVLVVGVVLTSFERVAIIKFVVAL